MADSDNDAVNLEQLFTVTDYKKTTFEIPCFYPVIEDKETSHASESSSHSRPCRLLLQLQTSPQACTDYDLTGQILWPVSVLTSHYLASGPGQAAIRNKTVVELGAGGTALPSLVAAHFAKQVVATDGDGHVVLDLLKQNVALQQSTSSNLSAMQLVWGDANHLARVMQATHGHVDVVIAADVVQWPDVVEPLLHTTKALLWKSPTPMLLLGIVNRASNTFDLFFECAQQLGFTAERIQPQEFLPNGIVPDACQEYGGRTTEMYRVILSNRSQEPVLLGDDGIDSQLD